MLDLATVTADTFRPHIDSTFTVVVEDHTFVLTLTDIDLHGEPPPPNHPVLVRQGFSMVFRTFDDDGVFFPQNVYKATHESLGEVELFFVPIGPDLEGVMRYEVILG